MPAELPTPSKAAPSPRRQPRHETIPPRRSFLRGLDRSLVMGTLWSVVIATDTGVRHVPPIYRRAALTMGSKRLHIWLKVILPAALPFIVSGMKQGWAFAWRSLMAAEIFVAILTGFGLGQLLHYGR